MHKHLTCSTFSPVFEILIHFSYSKGSTVVSPCGLSFNFNKNVIDDQLYLVFFHVFICVFCFVKCVLRQFIKTLSRLFSHIEYKDFLCMFYIEIIYQIRFANTYSQSMACIFTLLMVSFMLQKLLPNIFNGNEALFIVF